MIGCQPAAGPIGRPKTLTRNQAIRYVAFLRAINVGGKRMIKMEALRRLFESAGYQNVRTFIASGNVIFDATETDADSLASKIEKKLLKAFGHDVTVMVLTLGELQRAVKSNPFKKIKASKEVMLFVSFLSAQPDKKLKLPRQSVTENLDVIALKGRAAFVVAHHKTNGWFGFPNNFLEKELNVAATTRNWTTVCKVAALGEGQE